MKKTITKRVKEVSELASEKIINVGDGAFSKVDDLRTWRGKHYARIALCFPLSGVVIYILSKLFS